MNEIKFPSRISIKDLKAITAAKGTVLLVYTGTSRAEGKYLYDLKSISYKGIVVTNLDPRAYKANGDSWTVEAYSGMLGFAVVNDIEDKVAKKMLSADSYPVWKKLTQDKRQKETNTFTASIRHDDKLDALAWGAKVAYNDVCSGTFKQEFQNNEETKMASKLSKVKDKNVTAAKGAAAQAAGKILNKTIKEKMKPHLPMMVRGYADHALADVMVANIFSFVADNYLSGDTQAKAQFASEAMLQAAMVDLVASFNLEKLVQDVLSNVELPVGETDAE